MHACSPSSLHGSFLLRTFSSIKERVRDTFFGEGEGGDPEALVRQNAFKKAYFWFYSHDDDTSDAETEGRGGRRGGERKGRRASFRRGVSFSPSTRCASLETDGPSPTSVLDGLFFRGGGGGGGWGGEGGASLLMGGACGPYLAPAACAACAFAVGGAVWVWQRHASQSLSLDPLDSMSMVPPVP